MEVQLVSPEKILYSGEAAFVQARTLGGGDIAFLEGHAPFIGALAIHPVVIRPAGGGDDVVVAVHGGFVEVSQSRVTILSDVAELRDQVDVERARRALDAAGDDALARARAETRLAVAEGRAHAGAH